MEFRENYKNCERKRGYCAHAFRAPHGNFQAGVEQGGYPLIDSLKAIAKFFVITVGHVLSDAPWLTDIIGGVLLSAGLVTAYQAIAFLLEAEKSPETV